MGVGGSEIFVIFLAVLLLFGSKKIPEIARGLAKGMKEFKRATDDIKREIYTADITSDINKIKNDFTGDINSIKNDINTNLTGDINNINTNLTKGIDEIKKDIEQ
jgi:sec-independent protein translocase protein TatA